MMPATVSLLCICIAFVPMFGLGGVARLTCSARWPKPSSSRCWPPMSDLYAGADAPNHLLRHQRQAGANRHPLARFPEVLRASFRSGAAELPGPAAALPGPSRRLIAGRRLSPVGLVPWLSQDFFPTVDGGQITAACAGADRHADRGDHETRRSGRRGDHRIIPASELDGVADNIGLSVSGINMAYNNSGTIAVDDADILVSLKAGHAPTADYVKTMREQLPRQFPGVSFAFLPADMVSQILNFGAPAPIDLQIVGSDMAANRKYANALLSKIRTIPGIADARIQQAFQQPTLNVEIDRSLAGLVGLSEKDAATAMLTPLRQPADLTDMLANPRPALLPVDPTPPRGIGTMGAGEPPVSAAGAPAQLLGGSRPSASPTDAVARTTTCCLSSTSMRRRGAATSARSPPASARSCDTAARRAGASVVLRGRVATMSSAYQQLFVVSPSHVLIYLLIVVNFQCNRSVRDRRGAAQRAGRHRLDAVHSARRSVPALTSAIIHGRRHRQQHPGDQSRASRWRQAPTPYTPLGPAVRSSAGPDDGPGDDHRHDADGDGARAEHTARPRRDRWPSVRDPGDADPRAHPVQLRPSTPRQRGSKSRHRRDRCPRRLKADRGPAAS